MRSIQVFDFLSHGNMHQPFNEGYLRVVRGAFPSDEIVFHAKAEHSAALSGRFAPVDRITFQPVEPFTVPLGMSRHNPLAGRIAARRCLRSIEAACRGTDVRLVSLLGAEANLISVLRRSQNLLRVHAVHLILHNHIAEAIDWRSRNPIIRAFDLLSGLRTPLPKNFRLIALELGIEQAIGSLVPAVVGSVDTLEHPILQSEWGTVRNRSIEHPLRIAFVGHASRTKGFDHFCGWARDAHRSDLEFSAVGLASGEHFDTTGLIRAPSPTSLSRYEYVGALETCDLVCLPLPSSYDYVASGSVIDAIAQLKPLYSIENNSLTRMAKKYGPFGYFAKNLTDLRSAIIEFDRPHFEENKYLWQESLSKIRDQRQPKKLAEIYERLVISAPL